MRNVTLTKAGPSREAIGFDAGSRVNVTLADGAILEASFDVVHWAPVAAQSGPVVLPSLSGHTRVGVRFNLPTYPGRPVNLSVEVGP